MMDLIGNIAPKARDYTAAGGIASALAALSATIAGVSGNVSTLSSSLTSHTTNTSNPHSVTKTQVGLGNVPNTDTTNASNITSGTLGTPQGGTGLTGFTGANRLIYSTSASALAALASANNGVLTTNGSGVPSIATGAGAIADGLLSSNVPLKNAANAFTVAQIFRSPAASSPSLSITDATNYTLSTGYVAAGRAYFGGNTGTALDLRANATTLLSLTSLGNVVVNGTDDGAYRFQVGGNAKIAGTSTASSGTYNGLAIVNTPSQTGTAGLVDLLIDRQGGAVGSGSNYLIQGRISGVDKWRVDTNGSTYSDTILTNQGGTQALALNPRTFSSAASAVYSNPTFSHSSSTGIGVNVNPTMSTSGTGGWTALQVNATQAGDTGSGSKYLARLQTSGSDQFTVDYTGLVAIKGTSYGLTPLTIRPAATDIANAIAVKMPATGGPGNLINFVRSDDSVIYRLQSDGNVLHMSGGAYSLYNGTDLTNYERLLIDWGSNVARIRTNEAGTGTKRRLDIGGTNARFSVDAGFPFFNALPTGNTALTGNMFQIGGTSTASSGTYDGLAIVNTYNQTSTAGGVDLLIDRTNTAVGSGGQYFIQCKLGGTENFRVDTNGGAYGNAGANFTVFNAYSPTATTVVGSRSFTTSANMVNMATGTFTNSSGEGVGVYIVPTDSGTGTSAMCALRINLGGSGTGNGVKRIIDGQVASTRVFDVRADGSGGIGANASTVATWAVNGAAGTSRDLCFRSGGTNRWICRASADAESGSNTGSIFQLLRRADDGSLLDAPFQVYRDTGTVRVLDPSTSTGNFGIRVSSQFGSGVGVIGIANATTPATTNPSGGIVFSAVGGDAQIRSDGGNVHTLGDIAGFFGTAGTARPGSYTLAGTVTRTMPSDPSSAYTGLDNAQAGNVYAHLTDLNTLRTTVSSLMGVVRQLLTDLGSTSGYGLLAA